MRRLPRFSFLPSSPSCPLLLLLFFVNTSNAISPFNFSVSPAELSNFRTGDLRSLNVTVITASLKESPVISATCENSEVCEVVSISTVETTEDEEVFGIAVKATFLGVTRLNILVNGERLTEYPIRSLRPQWQHVAQVIFTVIIGIFIVTVTFFMGTQLEWGRIKAVLRRPFGPAIGFCCQFFIMPVIGFLLAYFVIPDDELYIKLALFAASTCPGGGKSSFWTIIFDGNLDLSVSMTFTQTVGALFMMPLWIFTLGRVFVSDRVAIPFATIVEGLAVLLIPSSAGMIFINYYPHLVERIGKGIKIATWIATIFFTAFGIVANFYVVFLFTWPIVIAGCLLPWSGYILAYSIATLCRQGPRERITIAIETGLQNVEPENDLSVVVLVVVMLATDKPLILIWAVRKLRRRCSGDKPVEKETTSKSGKDAIHPLQKAKQQNGISSVELTAQAIEA